MCINCYKMYRDEHGVAEVTDEMRAVLPLIDAVYEEHGAGGNLHIVVDDWNINDENLAWCADKCELTQAEAACLDALQELTVAERNEVMMLESAYTQDDASQPQVGMVMDFKVGEYPTATITAKYTEEQWRALK